jgi:hypothetical protein
MDAPKDPSEDKFVAALRGEDALGVVIRAHIHIEAKLVELLQLLLDASALDRMRLDYAQRVHLAVALGLKAEHAPPLLALGSLRNAFAHRIDTALDANRVENLYSTLSPTDKEAVQTAFARTDSQMKANLGPSFRNLPPQDQFVLIAVTLRAMLRVAIMELRGRIEPPQSPSC